MSNDYLSNTDKDILNIWKDKKDKPLFISGYNGSGKSHIANQLLFDYHIISINSDNIKKNDILEYINESLYTHDIFKMISSNINYKALLIDDIQLFSKYDKINLTKIYKLIKNLNTIKHPVIIVCNNDVNKTINLIKKISYNIEIKFNLNYYKYILKHNGIPLTTSNINYILSSDKNLYTILATILNFKKTDKDSKLNLYTTINYILSNDITISELIRLCSSEYSILSLNLLENIPFNICNLDISLLYNIYKYYCTSDYFEYKFINLNIDLTLKIFYSCIFSVLYSKQLIKKKLKIKYNSYISKSIIQIHNVKILKGHSIKYMTILNKLYNYNLGNIDKHTIKKHILHVSFDRSVLEKQIKVFNYFYHKFFTKTQVIKILNEVYEN